jgi:pimeloyl-ACP methyl ester carboxylesterase
VLLVDAMIADVDISRSDGVTPFWFGPESCRMLAWYHAPIGPKMECAVLLCPPFGHEYLVAYRGYRKLAETLAGAGFPCLFFDYDGMGDSVESDLPRVQAWRESILAAAAELRTASGVANLVLFGVRLGALLAASVANEVSAAALMMLAPVVAGRAFVREQLGFARLSPLAISEDSRQKLTDEEVVGYPFTHQTQQDLGFLDMMKMDCTCPSFVIERDDMPGQVKKLVGAWTALGRDIHTAQVAGYAAMMTQDAHSSVPPMEIWEAILDWLRTRFARLAPAQQETVHDMPVSMQVGQRFIEEVITFNGLVGVITSPSGRLPRKTAVVLTNIGASHRVGNHLLYVRLARSLAELGYCSIRFDRAGTGYSRPTPEGMENDVYASSGIDDVRLAMDCLQSRCPCTQVTLAGLCSGAYFSYHAAILDMRVKGLILINLLTFQWHDGDSLELRIRDTNKSTDFYLRTVVEPQTWLRVLKGEVAVGRIAVALTKRLVQKLRKQFMSLLISASGKGERRGIVLQNFHHLLKRRVKVLFVFGADDASQDVVAAELGRDATGLKSPNLVQVDTVSWTDHTFTPLWAQAQLFSGIGQFMQKHFR